MHGAVIMRTLLAHLSWYVIIATWIKETHAKDFMYSNKTNEQY